MTDVSLKFLGACCSNGYLTALCKVDLSENRLEDASLLLPMLSGPTFVEELVLSKNRFSDISQLGQLVNDATCRLQALDMSYQEVGVLAGLDLLAQSLSGDDLFLPE